MSHIDALIAELCPEGIEFRRLAEVAPYSATRVDAADLDRTTFVGVDNLLPNKGGKVDASYPPNTARLTAYEAGDVLLGNIRPYLKKVWLATGAGGCSGDVLALRVSSSFRTRLIPRFLYYLVSSEQFFAYDMQHAKGAKMPRGSKEAILRYRIPIPPVEVQREIVTILDAFTELQATLEVELDARRQQYEHYRDSLLTFEKERVRWVTLSDLGSLYGGLTGKVKADSSSGDARFVSYMNVFNNIATDTEPDDCVRIAPGERQNRVQYGDVLFTASSESADEVGMSSAVTAEPKETLYLNSFCFGFRPNDPVDLTSEFAKHLFRSDGVRRQIIRTANGVTRFNISKGRFREVEIPVPQADEQKRLAGILDHFDALVNDFSIGLPAELNARRRQYEHYRDRLLTFPEAA